MSVPPAGDDHAGDRAGEHPGEHEREHDGTPRHDDVDAQRRRVVTWLWRVPVLVAAGAGAIGVYEALRIHFFKRRPDPTPDFLGGPVVPVAPLSTFDETWAEAEFVYAATTALVLPALAVRLPGPIPGSIEVDGRHLAAFSRICTHLGCIVSLNRDAEAIAFAFNYRGDGPQLVCRCHLSVFDPERAGRAVAGPAVTPLPRLRLDVQGDDLVATGFEPLVDG